MDDNLTATKQVDTRDKRGRFVSGSKPVTGFHTNPERRSDGRWNKDTAISYWYNKFGRMTDEEIDLFKVTNVHLTIFQRIALNTLDDALKGGVIGLKATIEITDRTEGRPKQDLGLAVDESSAPLIKGFVIPTLPDDFIKIPDID